MGFPKRTIVVSLAFVAAQPALAGGGADEAANLFDGKLQIVPKDIEAQIVRMQCTMRDSAVVENAMVGLVEMAGAKIPDLAILTTQPVEKTESSGFGWRDDPIRHRPKFHSGTDFRGKHGTPVLAAGPGVVVFAGRQGGYGNMIEVDHGGGVHTRYAHLRRIQVKRDGTVLAGQQIGQVGATGRATGPHLHFEVRIENKPVDPVTAMSVADLERQAPAMGQIAALALDPEIQSAVASTVDPPKSRVRAKKKESRPDRPGRVHVVKPLS